MPLEREKQRAHKKQYKIEAEWKKKSVGRKMYTNEKALERNGEQGRKRRRIGSDVVTLQLNKVVCW